MAGAATGCLNDEGLRTQDLGLSTRAAAACMALGLEVFMQMRTTLSDCTASA